MTDHQIVDYLRTRGQAHPPADLVRSVMTAVDRAPSARSWFTPFLPAAAVAGMIAVITAIALLVGQQLDVGPAPAPSGEPVPTATAATLEELEAAVVAATGRLARGPVEGRQTVFIEEYLASATWFDWRPNGDQVVILLEDIDVSAPWWADPEGEPLTVGERVDTRIWVIVGDELSRSEDGAWVVEAPPRGPLTWGVGMLSGQVPAVGGADASSGVRVTRRSLDGGEVWTLETSQDGSTTRAEWRIGSDGVLDSYAIDGAEITIEGVDVTVAQDDGLRTATTRSVIEFSAVEDAGPIAAPDPDGAPDRADLGLPADFPLAASAPESRVDYREYVEVALEALETYHWNAANVDWTAARSVALDGLPDEPTAGQAHQRIISAIQTFDTFNTVFVRPGDVPPSDATGPVELPAGDRIGDVALISLPASTGSDPDALREYLRVARSQMEAADAPEPACGWIVDLRGVSGGAYGPLFSAVGGLLGEGRVITFDSAVNDWWVEVDAAGRVTFGSSERRGDLLDSPMFAATAAADELERATWEAVLATEPPYMPAVGDAPVVVLTSNATSSAGEQLVIGFQGRPATRTIGGVTAGSPHGLLALRMVDGAHLRMPTAIARDRAGTGYSENLMPDEVATITGPGGDGAVDAAIEWLEGGPGCS